MGQECTCSVSGQPAAPLQTEQARPGRSTPHEAKACHEQGQTSMGRPPTCPRTHWAPAGKRKRGSGNPHRAVLKGVRTPQKNARHHPSHRSHGQTDCSPPATRSRHLVHAGRGAAPTYGVLRRSLKH
ncbi:hypothetical protein E2C01_037691 [Portunus trituberculatus]|uniref:Uncharacterized protein n=1 Tax=Portunus trituberculatus TaxID=210409 RepID=A0A5B7FA08_PORTR|nr:hypothetical protein [Portunus trituberculatus]